MYLLSHYAKRPSWSLAIKCETLRENSSNICYVTDRMRRRSIWPLTSMTRIYSWICTIAQKMTERWNWRPTHTERQKIWWHEQTAEQNHVSAELATTFFASLARSPSTVSLVHIDSTCSRDSCSVCESSTSEEENTKSWKEVSRKSKNGSTHRRRNNDDGTIERRSKTPEEAADATHTRTTKYRKNTKVSNTSPSHSNSLAKIRIPKPELKTTSTPTKSSRTDRSKSPLNGSTQSIPLASTSAVTIPRSASHIELNYVPSTGHRKPKLMSPNSFSTDYMNEINSPEPILLKYQPQTIEKVPRPLPRLPAQSLQQHHDNISKSISRSQTLDWDVPDQTLGIPLTNPTPILDLHHYSMPPMQDTSYISNYPFRPNAMHPTHLQPAHLYHPKPLPLIKSKSMFSIPTNAPPVIHHPLVSGNIPPSFHSPESYQLKKHTVPMNQGSGAPPPPPKPANRQNVSGASILTTSTQQNLSPKKESGEKNKVKFSDTVTVAVVPVSFP